MSTLFGSSQGNSLFKDDTSAPHGPGREHEMRNKMMEAKFQEEKLRLQQRHDGTVQKILDRKNTEIDDLKIHYRNKTKGQDDVIGKLEKKVAVLHKELTATREAREREVTELKKLTDEASLSRQQELEKKLHDVQAAFEEERFSIQKQHTKNIQELLEDTNGRLTKMEGEYSSQMEVTSAVVRELEGRVQQLGGEADTLTNIRHSLERDKQDLEVKGDRLQADLMGCQDRCQTQEKEGRRQKEEYETELRTLKNKHDANIEFLKQEHSLAAAKAADRAADLEQQTTSLKKEVESAEQQRQNQIRELEHTAKQDKLHLERLHENKIRSLQKELDQLDQDHQKKARKMELSLRDKEEELKRLSEQHKLQGTQSEHALEDFKAQVERNSAKMYGDMKQQMERVEQDLNRSKTLREKQAREAARQMEEERQRHTQQLAELRLQLEQERAKVLQDIHMQKELWQAERDQELESVRETLTGEVRRTEGKAGERQERDAKAIGDLERQVHTLREEVVQANSLRKQQLVELGLLREEEKQKMQREHESEMSKVKSGLEQARLEQERKHSSDMEDMIEKTNVRLKEIEKEFSSRASKSNETVAELQGVVQELKSDLSRQQEEAEHELSKTSGRLEDEKRRLKQHHASSLMSLQEEVERHKSASRQLDRRLHLQEAEQDEKVTQLRAQYEERFRGLIPVAVRQELEDTIASLRLQITALQQRAAVLQEDIDQRSDISDRYAGSLGNSLGRLGGSSNTLASSLKT